MTFRTVNVKPNPKRLTITKLEDAEQASCELKNG